ncbi:glycosyltransferase [Aeromicrobium sp.]|uniref:glycosyltransferase family 2 protein n=1 Tax=Aeromicrobium sp. TaxID=1871063 RepID=UPI0025BF944C|nr:glycosyltransferase [Aeromicrobium sp.]
MAYRSAADLAELLPLLDHPALEVIVLDNASPDASAAVAEKHTHVRLVRVGANSGWTAACNQGAAQATAATLAFVNPDARPSPDDLFGLAALLAPDVASVSPGFIDLSGQEEPFCFRFPDALGGLMTFFNAGQRVDGWLGEHFIRRRTYDFGRAVSDSIDHVGAACLVVDAARFTRSGGFDDDMWLFFSDSDWCRREQMKGARNVRAAAIQVVHSGGGSVKHETTSALTGMFQRDYMAYAEKHYGVVGRFVTRLGAVLLVGLLPAGAALIRGRLADARRAVRSGWELLR